MAITITVQPQNVDIEATKGETLSEVLQRANIPHDLDCGGQGTCGDCAVEVIQGHCQWPPDRLTLVHELPKGHVLACQALVQGPLTVRVPETREGREPDFTSSLQTSTEISPPHPLGPLTLDLLGSGDSVLPNYGLACDIGTTTVALALVNLGDGKVVEVAYSYNLQIDRGADIISRILYARKPGHLKELQDRIQNTIGRLLEALLQRHGLTPEQVTGAVLSGNTTMTHLYLGIDPGYIRDNPSTLKLSSLPSSNARELGLSIHPEAPVLCTPAVGSYVGGDITSGVMAARQGLSRSEGESRSKGQDRSQQQGEEGGPLVVELFIDIGTNGELVVMGHDWMISCACSAGPAFEGVGLSCGMKASDGAIQAVTIADGGQQIDLEIIGGGKPTGLCGSGLIELLAELFTNGLIDRAGKFQTDKDHPRFRDLKGHPAFIIAEAEQTESGKPVYITEGDIANLIRAKAAIFSACRLLLTNVGLTHRDLHRIYIAGGFGSHLNIAKAVTIGLFPDLDPKQFQYLGNTSLIGAYLALLSSDHRKELEQTARAMTYVDLSYEPGYMDQYTGALFLPHTDENLFPNAIHPGKTRSHQT